jgi:hypothetical protein
MKTAHDRFCNEGVEACPWQHTETTRTTTRAAAMAKTTTATTTR